MALSFAAAHRVHKDRAYDYEPVGAEETRAEESVGSAVAESRSFPFGEDGFGVSHADYVDAESPASNDPGNAPTLAPEQALPLPTTPPSPTETETTSNDTLVPEQEATKSNDTDTTRVSLDLRAMAKHTFNADFVDRRGQPLQRRIGEFYLDSGV